MFTATLSFGTPDALRRCSSNFFKANTASKSANGSISEKETERERSRFSLRMRLCASLSRRPARRLESPSLSEVGGGATSSELNLSRSSVRRLDFPCDRYSSSSSCGRFFPSFCFGFSSWAHLCVLAVGGLRAPMQLRGPHDFCGVYGPIQSGVYVGS